MVGASIHTDGLASALVPVATVVVQQAIGANAALSTETGGPSTIYAQGILPSTQFTLLASARLAHADAGHLDVDIRTFDYSVTNT